MSVWSAELELELLALASHHPRATMLELTRLLNSARMDQPGLTLDQVTNKLKRLRGHSTGRFDLSTPGILLTDYLATIVHAEGDAAICACVHVPQTDPKMWERYLDIIDRDKIPLAIIAGDVVVGDMFSRWDIKESWRWEAEVESLRRHLVPLLERVKQVVILPGNHIANRIVKISGGQIKLKQVIDMAGLPDGLREKIVTTNLDYLDYRSGDEDFYVAHSASYSKIGGRVPALYAEKYSRHVIAGNGHQHGWQITASGKYHGIDLGTMADPRYMGYANTTLTTFPRMVQSFVTVRNGAVRVYGEGLPLTDWEAELAA